MADHSLPMQSAPRDALRQGLGSLKDDVAASHPVYTLQQNYPEEQWQTKERMMQSVYGTALPAKMKIERQILGRVQRLPGLPSARLGLDSLTGELDDFGFSSYLGAAAEPENATPSLHAVMEARLGLGGQAPTRELP